MMTDLNALLAPVQDALPPTLQAAVAALLEEGTETGERPLRLVLLGSFSVGKSSLLNMLIGEPFLYTARDEATSLPTFIEYAPVPVMTLVGADGSSVPLDRDGFRQATSTAPEGAACAVLGLPLPWLHGVSVVDLPGLGSVSAQRREYTSAQVQQADAVLYLLAPSGPALADIETLRSIVQYGKRVKVVVARWDEVEDCAARGEKRPDLERWAQQLHTATGLRTRLAGASTEGHGREEILDYIGRACQDVAAIRAGRAAAELLPLLHNALGHNAQDRQVCVERSEQEAGALHDSILERKQAVLAARTALYAQRQAERLTVEQGADDAVRLQREELERQLRQQATEAGGGAKWETFGNAGAGALRAALATLAEQLSARSTTYGDLGFPEARVESLNLRLPVPEGVDRASFLESGKLALLNSALEVQAADAERMDGKLRTLDAVDVDDEHERLLQLIAARNAVAGKPLARIIEQVEGNGAAQIGRFLGEAADIGLMFLQPATIATKVGALAGAGAKVVKVALNTEKVVDLTHKTFTTLQSVHRGDALPLVPRPVHDKLQMLQVLSLGYWGERIGNALGGAPSTREVTDPEDLARQQQALAELDQAIAQARRELARKEDLINERNLTGWALEQSRKEQQRIEQELARLTDRLAAQERDAARHAQEQHARAIQLEAGKACTRWLRSYDGQAAAMVALLMARVSAYWESHVDAALADSLAAVEAQMDQLRAAPEERELRLARLLIEAAAIDTVIAALS